MDLGVAYSYAGDLSRADEYANQAIKHASWGNFGNMTRDVVYRTAYKIMGDVKLRRGRPTEAIEDYRKALNAANDGWKFFVQVSLANAYVAAGNLNEAKSTLSGIVSPSDGRRAFLLRTLGNLALANKQFDEAVGHFKEMSLVNKADAAYLRVWALEGIGRASIASGNKQAALAAYLDAINAAQQLRVRFRNEEFKSGLFGEMRMVFDEAVRLLAEDGQIEKAFEISEQGRSRALLDMLRNRVSVGGGASAFVDTRGKPLSASEIRASLPKDAAVVQYHVLGDKTFAWVIRVSGVRLVIVDAKRDDIANTVEQFRDALFDRRAAAEGLGAKLHQLLISPLDLQPNDSLIIVGHDALHYLPFQALRNSDSFLIERHSISYAPSASALKTLLDRPMMSRSGNVVGLGNPDLRESGMALPGAQREVEHIKSLFPAASIFVRGEATKQRVVDNAKSSRLLHIAAHAEVDMIDPLFSKIRLSPNGSDRGELEAHEVYRLDLSDSQLVVLSACDSGLGRVSNGDEIWGFTRAFLGAGAGSIMVTLWPVADESTELLMKRFYEELAKGSDRRESLRNAQIALIKDPKFRAPFFGPPSI